MERNSSDPNPKTEPTENKSLTAVASSSGTPQWIDFPEDVTANILQRLDVEEILESAQKILKTLIETSETPIPTRLRSFMNINTKIEMVITPPWIDLPDDITANILYRVGAAEILESAQKVCTTWWRVSLDPALWRLIHITNPNHWYICRRAVDRSNGQLRDLSILSFAHHKILNYIVDRSSELKRLTLLDCYRLTGKSLVEAVKKLAHLEELHLTNMMESVQAADIMNIGISCPGLKSFSFNQRVFSYPPNIYNNQYALAIAKSMPNLCHLGLIANSIDNDGLEAILDGCPNLESLDLRKCRLLDFKWRLGKRCSDQIKHLKPPWERVVPNEQDGGYGIYRLLYEHKDNYGCWSDTEYDDDFDDRPSWYSI